MPMIGFPTFLEMMKEQTDKRCKIKKGDLFIVICGDEGVGKSLLAMALCFFIDLDFGIGRIFYRWKQYQQLLKSAMKYKATTFNIDKVKEHFKQIGANYDKLQEEKGVELPPGSAILYDEAGSGMSNRKAFDSEVLQQYLAIQRMRHLRMVNVWCAPKLWVIDKYVRNERIRFFIYVEDHGTLDSPKRIAHVWSRTSLRRIYADLNWQQTWLQGIDTALKRFPPDFSVPLPRLDTEVQGKYYISPQLIEDYEIRKLGYDYMEGDDQNDDKKKVDLLAKTSTTKIKQELINSGMADRTAERKIKDLKDILAAAKIAL